MQKRKRLVLEGDTLKAQLPGGRIQELPQARHPAVPKLDLLLMFDTTGSMFGYLKDVRDSLVKLSDEVIRSIPDVNVSIIAFGDHCDERSTYLVKTLPFTNDFGKIGSFIWSVGETSGGDAPEAYEDALAAANRLHWRQDARRVAVLVGDDVPHPAYACPYKFDAEIEVDKLATHEVRLYPVQCGDVEEATRFYTRLAERTGGTLLDFNQGFGPLVDIIVAICMKETGSMDSYQLRLEKRGMLTEGQRKLIRALREG
jgi:Mg-chelatase subunit ChlD